jgi:hypothetical protein
MTAPAPEGLPVRVDPALAEAVVWRVLSSPELASTELPALHADRAEPLYALADEPQRDRAFERLALAEFEELGLADAIRTAIRERPAVARRVRVVLVGEARGRADEGITWEPSGAHLGIRVDPARFDDPEGLVAWARHLLGHAEDTLDPGFGFEPGAVESTLPVPAQARFHRLWDIAVDARIAAAGRATAPGGGAPDRVRAGHRARLAGDLPGVAEAAIDDALDRLWSGPRPVFAELVAWAARPGILLEAGGSGPLARPAQCPLCRFPSSDVVTPEPSLAAMVLAEYPAWQPWEGLCGRCADRYRLAGRMGGVT